MNPVFDPLAFGLAGADLLAVELGGTTLLHARQQMRLRQVVDSARSRSAWWRERLPDPAAPDFGLACLPPTRRKELMARFEQWVTDPALDLARVRAHLADPAAIGRPIDGRHLVWESSGTSGAPGIFIQDPQALAVIDALHSLRRCASERARSVWDPLSLTDRIAFVGAIDGHFASYVSVERIRRLQPMLAPRLRSFSIMQAPEQLFAELDAFQPTVLATYPTACAMLCAENGSRLDIHPRLVLTGGETVGAGLRAEVRRSMGADLRDNYGASEFLTIGWECDHGSLHANTDWVLLEPIDAVGNPVPVGTLGHSCLLTSLAHTTQPLLRYDIGDRVRLLEHPCACGSPLPVIEVEGRDEHALSLRGRGGRMVTLLPLALGTVLEEHAGVFDYQIRQIDERTIGLRLAPAHASDAAFASCVASLRAFALSQGIDALQITDERALPIERGASGKVRRVIATAVR